jgi:putative endonuclease
VLINIACDAGRATHAAASSPAQAGDPVITAPSMRNEKIFWVYILASTIGGTLYIGVTSDLVRRVFEHRSELMQGFTKRYGVHRLVYFEQFSDIETAIRREKRLKKWNRAWKVRLIEETNPNWDDLFPAIANR